MPPSVKQLRIVNCVLCGFGLLVTALRLVIRYRRRKLWWDDFWIIAAALCTIVLMVANFYHTADPDSLPRSTKIAVYWLCIQFYYGVTWTSRLSILCTVIRITSTPYMRRFLHICAYLFGISWIILFAQVFWVCVPEQTWKNMPTPQCLLGDDVAVAQSITFIGTDAILVYAPVQLIWNARLPQGAKIRLIAIFAATILTTAASLYYIYAMLRINGITEEFAATVHDGISILVANLSVITSFVFGSVSASSSLEEHSPTAWPTFRRTPARSFGFISSLGPERAASPAHVQFHVEVERDYHTKSESLEQVLEGAGTFIRQDDNKDDMTIPEVIELRDMLKRV
ncbi:hypothetical protein BDY19DRAFT_601887 [Irpex rosettiformis]|uniref:Uncharacterized protein n=1 Tax=Irpex rosettiformis TaxID=378272 RepID=A0ACB8TPX4_9APHY|nr:hypothetical protein BDY19DRAFT_601887 [Irpex rosettiformis]